MKLFAKTAVKKVKFSRYVSHLEREEVEVEPYLHSSSTLEEDGKSALRPGRFTLRPILQEAAWAPCSFRMGPENLAPADVETRTFQVVANGYTD